LTFNTLNSGLLSNNITALAIDGNNNKWIGTDSGLVKYDGNTWTIYDSLNTGTPINDILAIAIDGIGNKWIGTNYGLAKFDGTIWTFYSPSDSSLPDFNVQAIAIDSRGNKWIGTEQGGIAKFDGIATWTLYNNSNSSLPSNNINSLTIDGSSNIWIGTGYGLAQCDTSGTIWTVYNTSNSGLLDNYISSLAIDGGGNKWIGTIQGGIAVFNGTGIIKKIVKPNNNVPGKIVLLQNYPNPFNPTTTINYSIPKSGLVTIKVYDVLGKEVRTLVNEEKTAGNYSVQFNGNNLSSGIYFYRMQSDNLSQTKKLILLK